MQLTTPSPATTIDLSDARCPNVVVGVIAALRQLEPGQVLQVIAADLTAPSNIAAWARQSGHTLLDMYEEGSRYVFYLQRGAHVSAATPSFR